MIQKCFLLYGVSDDAGLVGMLHGVFYWGGGGYLDFKKIQKNNAKVLRFDY
jgi:hypothetical protein